MGPTASGKTRLAIGIAQALNGEVISVDSALVYRGMDIGTAKPSLAERTGVPHHLIDLLDPAEAFSTGQFRAEALRLMAEITRRGRLPVLAGGTMLYFSSLLHGLAELPAADPELRQAITAEAERHGWAFLHGELARVDPAAAARIHPHDPQRIQRALEVYRSTGTPLSELCAAAKPPLLPYRLVRLVLAPVDRARLHERIRERFIAMLAQGLIDEVRTLRRRGDLHDALPSMRAVGYRQVWRHLDGQYDEAELIERAVIATRQFAKRQMTWLRRETDALSYASEQNRLLERVLSDLRGIIGPPP